MPYEEREESQGPPAPPPSRYDFSAVDALRSQPDRPKPGGYDFSAVDALRRKTETGPTPLVPFTKKSDPLDVSRAAMHADPDAFDQVMWDGAARRKGAGAQLLDLANRPPRAADPQGSDVLSSIMPRGRSAAATGPSIRDLRDKHPLRPTMSATLGDASPLAADAAQLKAPPRARSKDVNLPVDGVNDEPSFRAWYAEQARAHGLDVDPDAPEQQYDYRAAFRAGARPDASGHWPSAFKSESHPNRVVGGFDTVTGARVPGTPQASEAELVQLGWSPDDARRLSAAPTSKPERAAPPPQGSVLREFGRGVADIPRKLYETVKGAGDAAHGHIREGNYPAALHDLAAPILDPFIGAGLTKPGTRGEAVKGALELAGVPAVEMEAAAKAGNYSRVAGQVLGTAASFVLPVAASRGISRARGRAAAGATEPASKPSPSAEKPVTPERQIPAVRDDAAPSPPGPEFQPVGHEGTPSAAGRNDFAAVDALDAPREGRAAATDAVKAPPPGSLAKLTVQAEETLRAFRAEQDPAKQQALRGELAALKRQRDLLVGDRITKDADDVRSSLPENGSDRKVITKHDPIKAIDDTAATVQPGLYNPRDVRSAIEARQSAAPAAEGAGPGGAVETHDAGGNRGHEAPGRSELPRRQDLARAEEVAPANPPALARTPGPAATYAEVDPRSIQVDARTYQFKGGGDNHGVTDRLKAVESWDPIAGEASPIVVHERATGDRFVVDGHQRLGLATRLQEDGRPVPPLRAIVLREADGVTVSQARRIGAMLNLQQGTGTAFDVAKVLRDSPLTSAERARIPKDQTSGSKLRMGEDLAKLGDDAFARVINGQVHPQPGKNEAYGAIVGRHITDPAEQVAALQQLQKTAPETIYEAEQFVKAIQAAGFERGVQTDLFGASEVANSLAESIAKVMAAARRTLHSEKSALGNALRNEGRLAAKGNVLNQEANRAGVEQAAALDQLLDRYGHTAGPVREELKHVAAAVQRGDLTATTAADRLLTAVERERVSLGSGQPGVRPAVSARDESGGSAPASPAVVPEPRAARGPLLEVTAQEQPLAASATMTAARRYAAEKGRPYYVSRTGNTEAVGFEKPAGAWVRVDPDGRVYGKSGALLADATMIDRLDTGEAQPRLPGAEAARQVGQPDVTFRAPQQASGEDFSLANETTPDAAARRHAQENPDLFAASPKDTPNTAPTFERVARAFDEGTPPPRPSDRRGERGSLQFRRAPGEPVPIAADEIRSPNPSIERRFEPPNTVTSLLAKGRLAAAGVKDAFGRAFSFEYDLRKAGLDDAVERVDAFNRERADAPKRAMDRLFGVLDGLRRPEQYHLLQRIVMLRRDLELADGMQQGRIDKRPLESGLTPLEARAELGRLTDLAQREPDILAAAARHQELVRQLGDEMVDRGLMQASTRDRNADYFPAMVLEHLQPNASLVGRAVSPLTPGRRGFLKQAKGGARETVRDYIDAMSRHLSEVHQATMRDDLVKDLAGRYDRAADIAKGDPLPRGHTLWMYGDRIFVIPEALRERLTKFTQRTPDEVRAINRVTSWWKGATLRVMGVPFEVLNFSGDVVNFLSGEPLADLPKAPRRLVDAARGTAAKGKLPITTNPHLHDLQMLAQLGDQLNLGAGGATADVGRAIAQRPQLRELRRPLGETPLQQIARLPGDALVRVASGQDRFREFRESIPRLAKFMAEIERGQVPHEAARVARRELVDYTRLTDFERIWMRGALMPFYTWFSKNAQNWLPGLRVGADGSRKTGAIEASTRIGKVMVPAYAAALYNESFFPEAEHDLSEWDRNRFHLLVPWKGGLLYLGLTGPANAAAGLVGLQGATQRSIDLARGRTTIREEADRSVRQVRNNVLGLITPLTEPIEQIANSDLRSGRQIVPANMPLTVLERLTRRAQHAADRFAPVSHLTRAAGETTGAAEAGTALLRRLLTGSIAKPIDVAANRATAVDRAIGAGKRAGDEASTAERRQAVNDLASSLVSAGPEKAGAVVDGAWDGLDSHDRSLMMQALYEARRRDRRFSGLVSKWHAENRPISGKQIIPVTEELRRKGLPAPAGR